MGLNTHISWATDTINFGWGCTSISDACTNCYIPTTPPLRQRHMRFEPDAVGGTTGVLPRPDAILKPLSWPYNVDRRVFLNSLTDTFHEAYDDHYIARQLAVAAVTPRWIWLVLTKRHARMRALFNSANFRGLVQREAGRLVVAKRHREEPAWTASGDLPWPLPNVMPGVTVEQQRWAGPRLDALLDTPAAGRFVSVEPLLEDLDIEQWLANECGECQGAGEHVDGSGCLHCHGTGNIIGIDWVIAGGESGRLDRIRRTDPEWIDNLDVIVGQTDAQFHVKQLGAVAARELGCQDRNGRDPAEWPKRWPQDVPTLPLANWSRAA